MKYKFLALFMVFFLSVNVTAASITNGDKEAVKVNGATITNQEVYDKLLDTNSYSNIINVLDYKAMNEQYHADARLQSLIDKYYQQMTKDKNVNELYNLAGVKSKDEYINKAGIKLYALRELAAMDTAYDKIFTDEQKNFIYDNKISGRITIYHILIAPEATLTDNTNQDAITKAKQDANKKAQEVLVKLNNKAKFAAMVKEYSSDKLTADGKLGTYTINQANVAKLDPNIIKEAFTMSDKSYSLKPVETKYGYEIIYVEVNEAKKSEASVKNDIARTLYDMYVGNNPYTQQYALTLYRRANDIKIADNDLSKQYASAALNARTSFITFDPNQMYSQFGN